MTQENDSAQDAGQASDQGNNLAVGSPPASMDELHIVPMPDGRARYIPEETPDAGAMVLVTYSIFMEVVRELASGQMNGLRSIGAKLESCVVQNGTDVVQAMMAARNRTVAEDAKVQGYELGHIDGTATGALEGYRNGYGDGHRDGMKVVSVHGVPAQAPVDPPPPPVGEVADVVPVSERRPGGESDAIVDQVGDQAPDEPEQTPAQARAAAKAAKAAGQE